MKIGFENDCNYIKTINATCSYEKTLVMSKINVKFL